ncbi:integrase [Streptomyces sp. NPDC002514]|uniref:integrase n=1 Tax=unclassified Streptomyces TaxID=2593676 RepID=UPI003694A809
MERRVQTCRHELPDRTLIWNEHHLHRALREFEQHHNVHRPHQPMNQTAPLRATPEPLDPGQTTRLDIYAQTASAKPSTSTGTPPELHG